MVQETRRKVAVWKELRKVNPKASRQDALAEYRRRRSSRSVSSNSGIEWEAKAIVDSKIENNKLYYRVNWKPCWIWLGDLKEDLNSQVKQVVKSKEIEGQVWKLVEWKDTWEPEENLKSAPKLVTWFRLAASYRPGHEDLP